MHTGTNTHKYTHKYTHSLTQSLVLDEGILYFFGTEIFYFRINALKDVKPALNAYRVKYSSKFQMNHPHIMFFQASNAMYSLFFYMYRKHCPNEPKNTPFPHTFWGHSEAYLFTLVNCGKETKEKCIMHYSLYNWWTKLCAVVKQQHFIDYL